MTHTQQAEQEGLDLGRGTERVERILHPNGPWEAQTTWEPCAHLPGYEQRRNEDNQLETRPIARRKRSDAGKPRPKPPAPVEAPQATAGGITQDQRRELEARIGTMVRTREAMRLAIEESDKAQKYYENYLESLTELTER